ncbi:MAG: hypothetical protein EOO41_04360, partial [Methanobacteriota archaeon]
TVQEVGVGLADRVPMYKQMTYKYHLYVEGHCAAMRYASMMPLGAVILKVASLTKADNMWYFPLLRPYNIHAPLSDAAAQAANMIADHIPVAADMSDLAHVLTWCKQHDSECEQIATNSKALHARLIAQEGQLDYMQLVCYEIARRTDTAPPVPAAPTAGSMLCPTIAARPTPSGDWFDADCEEYSNTLIGPSVAPLPQQPKYAAADCECPRCAAIFDARAAVPQAPAPAAGTPVASVPDAGAASSGSMEPAASFVMTDSKRAIVARRAAAAKAAAAAAAAAAATVKKA